MKPDIEGGLGLQAKGVMTNGSSSYDVAPTNFKRANNIEKSHAPSPCFCSSSASREIRQYISYLFGQKFFIPNNSLR